MRQLILKVPIGKGETVKQKAKEMDAKNLIHQQDTEKELITLNLNNVKVGQFLNEMEHLVPEAEISFFPSGIIALYPPIEEVPEKVTSVSNRSPIEVYMSGLQSVGTKKGMVGYAIMAGAVVWIGLYTNTMYLLTASMLIAPFGGPAMNAAIATASGDVGLLKQSSMRYFSALGITIFIAFLLSLIFGLTFPTPFMTSISQISQVAILLPLAAGLAGALNLIQSERDSLVSGAAVGVLAAASLAPPAGIAGMAMAIGRWDMVVSGVLLLFLQLAVINFSAALMFRFYGKLDHSGIRFLNGKKSAFGISLAVSFLVAGGLIFWQLNDKPALERSSLEAKVAEDIKSAVSKEVKQVELVQATATFTRSQIKGMNPMLCEIAFIRSGPGKELPEEELKERILQAVNEKISADKYNITPLFNLTLLKEGEGPAKSE